MATDKRLDDSGGAAEGGSTPQADLTRTERMGLTANAVNAHRYSATYR
jgi:hypothetical protein